MKPVSSNYETFTKKQYELEKRLAKVDERLLGIQRAKRSTEKDRAMYLRNRAESLLPDFSQKTQDTLFEIEPIFMMQSDVVKVFKDNRKLFGIFKRKNSDVALVDLRVDLARHLEEWTRGDLTKYDVEIRQCELEIKELSEEKVKIIKILEAMKPLIGGLRPRRQLSPKLSVALTKDVKPAVKAKTQSNDYTSSSSSNDDYDDLLTLLLFEQQFTRHAQSVEVDPPFHGKGGTMDGGGASGDWDSSPSPSNDNGNSGSASGSAAAAAAIIATDDSLGNFS